MHMYAGGDTVRGEGGAVLTLVSEPYLYSHFRCNMTLTNMHSDRMSTCFSGCDS